VALSAGEAIRRMLTGLSFMIAPAATLSSHCSNGSSPRTHTTKLLPAAAGAVAGHSTNLPKP
jgi:hypothetical protein